jgi:hypothetical protein
MTQIELLYLLVQAEVLEPVFVDVETAARMVRPYTWLLDRIGAEGIKLTSAGYLPPAHVEAAAAELGLADEWIGSYNRENQTLPVLELRESAMRLGLLRKFRGRLVATPSGRVSRGDPVALWWHLAEKVPPQQAARPERHAGILLLAAVAQGGEGDPFEFVARMLYVAGWSNRDGTELSRLDARGAARETNVILRRLGAFADPRPGPGLERPTQDGVLFARAALRTWSPGSPPNTKAHLFRTIRSSMRRYSRAKYQAHPGSRRATRPLTIPPGGAESDRRRHGPRRRTYPRRRGHQSRW